MYFLLRNSNYIRTLCMKTRFYSFGRKTHYEVLNLQNNCSEKQIKDAFIQLSKEYHPDKNKDPKAQEQFVRVVEAYNVLSKPGSRARYDCTEIHAPPPSPYEHMYRPPDNYQESTNHQYSYFYENRDKSKDAENEQKPYYGIHNVKKVDNSIIIFICASVAIIGFILQMMVVRQTFFGYRRETDEKSKLIAMELEKVRNAARLNGNDRQTQKLIDRIVNDSNSTIATAALGQSLANPRK